MVNAKAPKCKFKACPIDCFHVDTAEVRTAGGKLRLFVAIDRTSKFAAVELHEQAGNMIAARFLRTSVVAVPYAVHTMLADNDIQFTDRACDRYAFYPT